MRKQILLSSLIVICVVAAGIELRSRAEYRDQNADDPNINNFVISRKQIQRAPNTDWTFVFMDKDGVQIKAKPRTNALGFFSQRPPHSGDGRTIVIIGGEQTASGTVTTSWPDHLQELLGDGYRVFNLGWPDAGPAHYINYWKKFGVPLKPDLVLINFVATDFYRGIRGAAPLLTLRGRPIVASGYASYPLPKGEARVSLSVFEGARYTPAAGDQVSASLKDPNIVASRPYGVLATDDLDDEAALLALKDRVVSDMIDGAIDHYGCVTCALITGIRSVHELRNFDPIEASPKADPESLMKFGKETFGWMARNIPNVQFLRSFAYADYTQKTPAKLADMLAERDPRFTFVDMRNHMPDGDPKTWFHIPWMGEKFSEAGMRAYAEAVAKVVKTSMPLR